MTPLPPEKKQQTQPMGKGEPMEIPVPKRGEFFDKLKRASKERAIRRTSTKR